MRIALCLSGQPRFFERGYEFIKKYIIDPNENVDIFTHLWFDESEVGNEGFMNTSDILIKDGYKGDFIKPNIVEEIISLYNPKKIKYEKQYNCNEFIKNDYVINDMTNPFATFSSYLSSHKSIQLKNEYELENNFEYDMVIKCRYDLIMDKPLIINKITDCITFHNDVNHPTELVFNDGVFYGDNKSMTKLISESYLSFDGYSNTSLVWNNHYLIGKYIKDNNIIHRKINMGNIRWIRR